jgi:hypothetical protein
VFATVLACMDSVDMPRQSWAAELVVEQLLSQAPPTDRSATVMDSFKGATPRSALNQAAIRRCTYTLVEMGVLRPVGVGNDACFHLRDAERRSLLSNLETLPRRDREWIWRAAQRAAAVLVAWANTSTARGSSIETTSTASIKRRHARV